MTNEHLTLNANPVVAFLKKNPEEFTKEDIILFITDNGIRMVNFMYPGGDGIETGLFVIGKHSLFK